MYDSGIRSHRRGSLHCCTVGHSGHYEISSSRVPMIDSSSRACPNGAYNRLHPTRTLGSYIAGHILCLPPALHTANKGRKVQSFDRLAHWIRVDTGSSTCWNHLAYRSHRFDTCRVLYCSRSAVRWNPLDIGTAGDPLSPHSVRHSDSANWHRGTSHNPHSWSQCNPERATQRASDVKTKSNHSATLQLNGWRLLRQQQWVKGEKKMRKSEFHFVPDLWSLSL